MNKEGWPGTFGGIDAVMLITTLDADKTKVLEYLKYHELFTLNVSVCSEIEDVMATYTKLLASVVRFRDTNEGNHHKGSQGDMNMELIKDTVMLCSLWQETSTKLMGGQTKKKKVEKLSCDGRSRRQEGEN